LTTEEWMGRLRDVVPAAPVQSMEAALDPGELQDRGMLVEYDHPNLGEVRSIGPPVFIGGYRPRHTAGPGLGADRLLLLDELGYDPAEVSALGTRGAFGAGSS